MKDDLLISRDDSKVEKVRKILTLIFLLLFLLASLVSIFKYFTRGGNGIRERDEYFRLFLQCISGFGLVLFPLIFRNKIDVEVEEISVIMYLIFIFMAIYLANVFRFYQNIVFWDDILHFFSGIVLTSFSYTLIRHGLGKGYGKVSPILISIFALSLSMFLGVIWEFYEFIGDGLTGSNMQMFMTYGGELKVGRDALLDTMGDLLLAFGSSLLTSGFGYVRIKKKYKKED